jgi:NAD(P)-dependent dehydrogenase (short-subunit alcohol dehydrogenase family)
MSTSCVWLVTGTSSGLGRNLVEEVLASGERVVAVTRRASSLSSLAAAHSPKSLLVLELDITSNDQIKAAFQQIKSHFGRVDVVVNNAGYALKGEVEAISDEQAMKQMEVNFWAPVRISREAVRFFREENPANVGGYILNISSSGGFNANPAMAFYNASKFALEGFSEALSKEIPSEWNIHVVIVQPGGFRTDWNKGNMDTIPPHPAYAGPDTPSSKYRPLHNLEFIGDPVKAAKAMIKISKAKNPPMRLQLGPDALHVIRFKCATVLKDAEEWEALSQSTVADDADPAFLAKLGPVIIEK